MVATLRKVKRIGYDAAQISGVGPIEPAELRAIMLDAGVDPIGAHVGLEDFRQNLGKVIADCHAWGVGYVAIPWLPRQDFKTQQDWKRLFKEFEGYARALRREAIVVQYHNHKFEFEKFGIRNGKGGRTILEMMYEHTRVLQAELDFGWVARGGQDPAEWALKMKGRLDQVHLKVGVQGLQGGRNAALHRGAGLLPGHQRPVPESRHQPQEHKGPGSRLSPIGPQGERACCASCH
jgi:sugar phosphate isomerase/epimerase